MFKLGNSYVSAQQLLKLGAHIHQDEKEYFFYPDSLGYETDLLKLYKKNISLRAENWFSYFYDKFENIQSKDELNCLLEAAKHLKFRGSAEFKYPIDQVVRLMNEFDLRQDEHHLIISYWLKKIFKDTHKPNKIYSEQQFIDLILTQQQFEKVMEIDGTGFVDSNLFVKFNNSDEDSGHGRLVSKRLVFKVVKSNVKLLKALSNILFSSKGFLYSSAELARKVSLERRTSIISILKTKPGFKTIKIIKNALVGPGTILTLWDATDSTLILMDSESSSKDQRDAIATFVFIGGELITTGILIANMAGPGVSLLVTLGWLVLSFYYSGGSLVYEYKDENLSVAEFLHTFGRGFLQLDLPPNVQEYLDHRKFIQALAEKYYSYLVKEKRVCFVAGGIGRRNINFLTLDEYIYQRNNPAYYRFKFKGCFKTPIESTCNLEKLKAHEIAYQSNPESSFILPSDLKIVYAKKEIKKLSRLRPKLSNPAAHFLCSPNFKEDIEPHSTALRFESEWDCDNGIMITTKADPLNENCTGLFELSLAESGSINFGEHRVNFKSEFWLLNNSTIQIKIPGYDSLESKFVLPPKGCNCKLIGDPMYGKISSTVSYISAERVEEVYSLIVANGEIITQNMKTGEHLSKAQFNHIPFFWGHKGQDIIDCKYTTIKVVNALGGLPDAYDHITDCSHVILDSYTIINNTQTFNQESQLIFNNKVHNIIVYNNEQQNILFFIDYSLAHFLTGYELEYKDETKTFNYRGTFTKRLYLTIHNFNPINSNIIFIDKDKISAMPQFLQSEDENSNKYYLSIIYTVRLEDTIEEALELAKFRHSVLLKQFSPINFVGRYFFQNPSDQPSFILGGPRENIFILDTLEKLTYISGHGEVDIYKINEELFNYKKNYMQANKKLNINNYSITGKIDKLFFPFLYKDIHFTREKNDLKFSFSIFNKHIFIVEKYFLNSLYQHLIFIDSEQTNFIPYLNANNVLSKILYYKPSVELSEEFFENLENEENSFSITFENTDFTSQPQVYRNIEHIFLKDENKVIKIPIEQFKPIIAISVYKTYQAAYVHSFNTIKDLISVDTKQTRYILDLYQEKVDESITIYTYTKEHFKNNNTEIHSIIPDINADQKKYRYIELSELPFDIKIEYNFDNLFLTFFNEKNDNLNLLIFNWDNNNKLITSILVSGQRFVFILNFQSMDLQHLQESERAFREKILLSKLDDLLEKNSFKQRLMALKEILNLSSKNSKSKDEDFCNFLDFDSADDMLTFQHKISQIEYKPTLTHEFAQSFLFYYLKIMIRYPEFKENFGAIITYEQYQLLFKNFEENLHNNFRAYLLNLSNYIADDYLVKEIFFKLLVQGHADRLIKNEENLAYFSFHSYSFKQEDFTHPIKTFRLSNTSSSREKWSFIDLTEIPEDILFQADSNDLLIILRNNENKKIAIQIKNWSQKSWCIDGIIVKEELLTYGLCKKNSTSDELNNLVKNVRIALLRQWINSKLNTFSGISRQEGLFIIIDQVYYKSSYSSTLNFYKLFGFYSRTEMSLQYDNHLHKIITKHKFNFDEIQKNEIAKVFVLNYVKIISERPDLVNYFLNSVSIENYKFLLKDFNRCILEANFTSLADLKEKIFNSNILMDIYSVIDNIQEKEIKEYFFEIRTDSDKNFFSATHDYIITHNHRPGEFKPGFLSLDVPPYDINIDRDRNDLLFILSDTHQKKGIIRVKNWNIPSNRLEGLIIAGKILPTFNDFGFINETLLKESEWERRSKTNLMIFNLKIRKILIELFLLSKLELVPDNFIEIATCYVINEMKKSPKKDYFLRIVTSNDFKFFKLQEFINLFKNGLRYQIPKISYSSLEKRQIAKVILTLCLKLMLECYPIKDILDKFFPNHLSQELLLNFEDLLKTNLYFPISILNGVISNSININRIVSVIDAHPSTEDTQFRYHKKRSEPNPNNHQLTNLDRYHPISISNQSSDSIIDLNISEPKNLAEKYVINLTNLINSPRIVKVNIPQNDNTLLLNFEFNQGKNYSIAFHDYLDIHNRIYGIIINSRLVFDELEFLDLEEYGSLEKILNAAIIKSWAQVEQVSLLFNAAQLDQFKAFLILKVLDLSSVNSYYLSKGFSFKNPLALKRYCQVYLNAYEQHKIRNLATTIYRNSKIVFFQLIYLTVLEMTQSNLNDEKIQSLFPYLTTPILVNYLNNLAIRAPYLLKNESTLSALISESATAETNSFNLFQFSNVRVLYVPGDIRNATFIYCSFRESEFLNLALINYNLINVNIFDNNLTLSLIKSRQTLNGINKETVKLIQILDFENPFCRLYGLKDSNQGWEILVPYNNVTQLKDNLQNLLNEKLSSVQIIPQAIDLSNSEESMQADQDFLDNDEIKVNKLTSSSIPINKPNLIKSIKKKINDIRNENIDSKKITYFENWHGWAFGLGGLGISACLGYSAWILRRHSQLNSRRHPKPEISPALSFRLLSAIPKVQSANLNRTKQSFSPEKKSITVPLATRFKHPIYPIDTIQNSQMSTRTSAFAENYMEKYEWAMFQKGKNKPKQVNHKKKQRFVKLYNQKQTTAPKQKNNQFSQTPYKNYLSQQVLPNTAKLKIKHAASATCDFKSQPNLVNPYIKSCNFIHQKKQTQYTFIENQLSMNAIAFNKQPRLRANYQDHSYFKKSFSLPNSLQYVCEKPDMHSTLLLLRITTQLINRQPSFFSSATRKPSDKMFRKMERQIDKVKSNFLIK